MIKVRKLTAKEQAAPKAVAAMPDREIATSNSPEFRDWKRCPVRWALSGTMDLLAQSAMKRMMEVGT